MGLLEFLTPAWMVPVWRAISYLILILLVLVILTAGMWRYPEYLDGK